MNCPCCGAAVTDDSKFCNYCGAKLPEIPKEDKKRREFRFEFNNEHSVRKAEIKKERERQQQEYALKTQENLKKMQEQEAKSDKRIFILFVIMGIIGLILILSGKK